MAMGKDSSLISNLIALVSILAIGLICLGYGARIIKSETNKRTEKAATMNKRTEKAATMNKRMYKIMFWNRIKHAVDSLLFEAESVQQAIDEALASNNVEESEIISINITVSL